MAEKKLTLRLPAEAYERAAALAKRRGQSLNRLFQDGLSLLDSRERERQLFDDFTALGAAGPEALDIEFAQDAQVEATRDP